MPDPDLPPQLEADARMEPYPIGAAAATPSLQRLLEGKIRDEGPLSFPDYMAATLYHPELGYYARGDRQVGRGGDFFTSVSVGPLFGGLLARRFLALWREWGEPAVWRILECGAHDGKLAADVLEALLTLAPAAWGGLEYAIVEPLPALAAAQSRTLARHGDKVRIVADVGDLAQNPLPGIIFGNELLDALPFHVVEFRGGDWHECRVGLDENSGNFCWCPTPLPVDGPLRSALDRLGNHFPDGYRTEIRVHLAHFLEPLTRCLSRGMMIWPDYGFARAEYYLPERHEGTLRTFFRHRAGSDPFETPGERDITAHVDFTALAEAAVTVGMQPRAFRSQGSWLTLIGREWLLSLEGRPQPELMRQFQTLTHPTQLGGSFHVIELGWKLGEGELPREDAHRLGMEPG